MTYRVIQWATGLVGQDAIKGVLAHPELELVGCWVHSPEKVGPRRRRALRASTRSASTATDDVDEILRDRRRLRRLRAGARKHARRWSAMLESGKNVVTPVGWIYPIGDAEASRSSRPRAARGNVDAARHRHPSRRHHRAVPADALGDVPQHPPRPRRGVLRHPQLPDRVRRARRDAVRQAARAGGDEPDARRSSATASGSRST